MPLRRIMGGTPMPRRNRTRRILPSPMRWIIGDIHGMLRPLQTLLEAVAERDPAAELFFCGDYVDRGPNSAGVIDLLLALPRAKFVRGNHDDALDFVLHAAAYAPHPDFWSPGLMYSAMANAGMDETFVSYGADRLEVMEAARRPTAARIAALAEAVPERHKAFIRHLPPVVEADGFFVAHAWWSPIAPDEFGALAFNPGVRHELLWGRYSSGEVRGPKRWERTGYFGHTPTMSYARSLRQASTRAGGGMGGGLGGGLAGLFGRADHAPIAGPSIVLLDTAAALVPDGRLTAWCHDTGECLQVHRAGDLIGVGV